MNNKVELIGIYGSDWTHVNSAWTSIDRNPTEKKKERMPVLLRQLAQDKHETPFEKSSLHFLVTGEIASHIHVIKHRIAVSVNTESARYRELKDKWYLPTDWPEEERERLNKFCEQAFDEYHACIKRLEALGFDRKRAKESARFYLPYANQLIFDVMFNFRSFMHFQGLRNKPDAQLEIREIAEEMMRLVKETNEFEHSLKAFGY